MIVRNFTDALQEKYFLELEDIHRKLEKHAREQQELNRRRQVVVDKLAKLQANLLRRSIEAGEQA